MKAFTCQLTLLILIIICSATANAHVGLTTPEGGESFVVGKNVSIEWYAVVDHGPCNWDVLYSDNGGIDWVAIATDLPKSTLTMSWPAFVTPTSLGRIKIIQDNSEDIDYEDFSPNFTIAPATPVPGGSKISLIILTLALLTTSLLFIRK